MRKRTQEPRKQAEKRIKVSDDLLWGIHPVYELLVKDSARATEVILQKEKHGKKYEEIVELCRKKGVKLSFVSTFRLTGDGASQARHQGVLARTSSTPLKDFDEFVSEFETAVQEGKKPRVVVCDSLQDPHNIGAIVRSALASGAFGVVLTRERSAPLGGTAAKSSAGAMAHIDICQVTNLVTALKKLKKAGAWVYGTIKDDEARSLYETDLKIPVCIVMGSEGKGVRPLVRKECDGLITIPMAGTLDSLNSSAAAAVVLFEALRQELQGE